MRRKRGRAASAGLVRSVRTGGGPRPAAAGTLPGTTMTFLPDTLKVMLPSSPRRSATGFGIVLWLARARDGMGGSWATSSRTVPWICSDGSAAAPAPAGGEMSDDAEAAGLLGVIRAYLRLLYLYKFIRCWDTASESAAAALCGMVSTGILPLYGEGRHPVKTAIANALPNMLYVLSVEGRLFDSNEIERAFYDLLGPYEVVRPDAVHMRHNRGGELLKFIGMCTRNGIDPADGLDMLVVNPD